MSKEEIEVILKAIFNSNFKNSKKITIQSNFDDIDEMDSLSFAILINEIEENFTLKFELEDMFNFDSVKSIRDSILKIQMKN